jgi:hypothetical protein
LKIFLHIKEEYQEKLLSCRVVGGEVDSGALEEGKWGNNIAIDRK